MLFEEKNRTRISPMRQGERTFEFYDTSGRESFSTYRKILNCWLGHYPKSERTELIRRFSTGSDSQYFAAQAEVTVHEVLHSSPGCVEYHPTTPHSSRTPNFMKRSVSGKPDAYIEVTTCAPAERDVASGNRFAAIYNAVDKIHLPAGYVLGLRVEEHGKNSPKLSSLTGGIERWVLGSHTEIKTSQPLSRVFAVQDWKIEITLLKFSDPNKQAERSIGFHSGGAHWRDGSEDIRTGLETKARRYGLLDAPYLIVIADYKGEVGWGESAKRELVEALFGDEAIAVRRYELDSLCTEPQRKLNGFFGHPQAPKNQNVSAVLLLSQPDLWSLRNPMHQPLLVHHPWPNYSLPLSLMPIPSLHLGTDDGLKEVEGEALADLLKLPADWPPPF